ncbi:hypothetical protein [Novosphingobium sp.]|uniref:hypothetical protein n=1 Tax=Novosphingobium sp. TaxID=1874826 RepID=UPI002736F83E|nr:hypothetical protein [Novosphingobium sp.]MDP3907998.1 hypothetical protein [Novosphingobium sp.]
MKRKVMWSAAGAGLLAASGVAWACADFSCSPSWKLGSTSHDCASNAVLSPGNDSRVNLLFLLRGKAGLGVDAAKYPALEYESGGYGRNFVDWQLLNESLYPKPPRAEDDEGSDFAGSRCISLNTGTPAFLSALNANPALAARERSALGTARQRLEQTCRSDDTAGATWPADLSSPAAKAFLGYLQASDAFYAERWAEAEQGFAALAQAPDPWVRETAAYMLGRVNLNAAQAKSFDEYGWYEGLKTIEQTAVTRAKAQLAAYLKAWPNGRYAVSATGLQRRALWLEGNTTGLAAEYARLLGSVPAGSAEAARLVEEIDNKLLFAGDRPAAASGPLLLAALDLVQMRDPVTEEGAAAPGGLTEADLAAQAPAFAGEPELYGFVQASHAFYVQKDYRKVLTLIPDDARRSDYAPVAFSRQVLRGMALSALGDRNTGGFWRELLGGANALWQRPTVELGLALHMERGGQIAQVFAKDSPVQDTTIRKILLTHSAGPAVLRSAAQDGAHPQAERDAALFTLLYKQLTRGDYAGFVANRPLVPVSASKDAGLWNFTEQETIPVGLFAKGRWSDGYPCQSITVTAQKLAENSQDTAAQLCLGDFLRLNAFDGWNELDDSPDKDELGGAARDFAGKPLTREAIYSGIIANRAAPANDRAYALYRMVNCYAPSGYNGCGGTDAEVSQRKAWFTQLKREYPSSPWAKKLRVYW